MQWCSARGSCNTLLHKGCATHHQKHFACGCSCHVAGHGVWTWPLPAAAVSPPRPHAATAAAAYELPRPGDTTAGEQLHRSGCVVITSLCMLDCCRTCICWLFQKAMLATWIQACRAASGVCLNVSPLLQPSCLYRCCPAAVILYCAAG